MHRMLLERYLGKGSIELLKRQVKSFIKVPLKALFCLFIYNIHLRKQQEAMKQQSAIVIIIKGKVEANKLCAFGFQLGGIVRVVERYWEVIPSLVCIKCWCIGYKHMRI